MKTELESLKALAKPGHAKDFCALAQRLLLEDFDQTYDFIKVQKIFVRSRDILTVKETSEILNHWILSAPLPGNRKSRLRRHLEVCVHVQSLYDEIDQLSNHLGIWKCSRREMSVVVLEAVEQCYEMCRTEGQTRDLEGLSLFEAVDSSRSITSFLRDHCDVGNTLLTQISRRCPANGQEFDHRDDLREAIRLASLYDDFSMMFNQYTYNRWRASCGSGNITFHPAFDDYDRARQWCAQRIELSHHRFRDDLTIRLGRMEQRAIKRATIEPPASDFPTFFHSGLCESIKSEASRIQKIYHDFLTEQVGRFFDVDTHMQTPTGVFTVGQLLAVWSGLWFLGILARTWNLTRQSSQSFRDGQDLRVPIVPFALMENLFASQLGMDVATVRSVVGQFTTNLDLKTPVDLFYRPLLLLSNEECALGISYAETGRFERNVFKIALRDSDMDVAARGFKPLPKIKGMFSGHDYSVSSNFPLMLHGDVDTDADLLAYKDGYLFVGQMKVVIEADSLYEVWQTEQKLAVAAAQLAKSLALIRGTENLDRLLKELNIPHAASMKIVAFILTNDWHFTGIRIQGFSVIDQSYLEMLLTEGAILTGTREKPVVTRLFKDKNPSPEELKRFVENPLHRGMFTRPTARPHKWVAGNLSFTVPVIDIKGA